MDYRRYHDLVCPDCGSVLHEVSNSGARNWFCVKAIGEAGVDQETGRRVMEEGSKHQRVIAYTLKDAYIRGQLEVYEPPIVGKRLRLRKEEAA